MIQAILDLPTATRNPLLIPELFQCILDAFAIPEGDLELNPPPGAWEDLREAQRALASLAQTCRALSEPSLDRLWWRLDSLEPLIRCFAPAVDEDRAKTPPSPAEWTIITRYSHRVRELALQSLVDDLFLGSTSSCSRSPFLFPNLRVLRWSVSSSRGNSDLTVIMRHLLSPNLVSLSTTLCRTRRGIDSFLQNYILHCPGLKSVKLDIYQSLFHRGKVPLSEIHQLSQAIHTHEHLESLVLSIPINDVALRRVMLSSRLRVVSLVLHPMESNLGNVRITSADTPFRNVKDLELLVWDLQFVLSLLRLKDQMFHTFRLRFSGLHEARTIVAFLATLGSPTRTDSLELIHLTSANSYAISHEEMNTSYDNAIHRLTYDILRPLTSFKRLRELVLLPFNQTFLNDEELEDLARSWPMLEVLKLNSNHGCYGTSITLRGLLLLLRLCPRLRELRLSLDARAIPKKASIGVCNTILTSLRLPDSPINDARLVAEFFARHLPSVTHVDVYFVATPSLPYRPPEEYGVVWAKVNEYLWMD